MARQGRRRKRRKKAGAFLQPLIANTPKTMQGISRTILGHPQDTDNLNCHKMGTSPVVILSHHLRCKVVRHTAFATEYTFSLATSQQGMT